MDNSCEEQIRNYNAKAATIEAELRRRVPLLNWDVERLDAEMLPSGAGRLFSIHPSYFTIHFAAVINAQKLAGSQHLHEGMLIHGSSYVLKVFASEAVSRIAHAIGEWRPKEQEDR